MIFPYLYTDMSLKRAVILSILSASVLVAHASAMTDNDVPADTIWFEDGAWYVGQIADSLFNGFGKMVYPDSTVYEGEWKDGLWDGKGELFYPDGDSYNGEFSEHEFSGYGTYLYADGARYEGYWERGMFNGSGTMTYADSSVYAGEWKDDMKDGIGVFYDSPTGALLKGYFSRDMFMGSTDRATNNSNNNNDNLSHIRDYNLEWNPFLYQRRPDSCWHWKRDTYLYVTYGTGSIISFHADFYTSKRFFAGFSFGFSTKNQGIGKESVTYDDDTGERITLIDWDWYPDEIMTESTNTLFKISGQCGLSWGWFSVGTALGIGLQNTVRNCRSLPGNDSYYEDGTLYYRSKITGARFAYDIFTDYVLSRSIQHLNSCSLRAGYGNIEGFHIGVGLSF
jgi:hypothetical protein